MPREQRASPAAGRSRSASASSFLRPDGPGATRGRRNGSARFRADRVGRGASVTIVACGACPAGLLAGGLARRVELEDVAVGLGGDVGVVPGPGREQGCAVLNTGGS